MFLAKKTAKETKWLGLDRAARDAVFRHYGGCVVLCCVVPMGWVSKL